MCVDFYWFCVDGDCVVVDVVCSYVGCFGGGGGVGVYDWRYGGNVCGDLGGGIVLCGFVG